VESENVISSGIELNPLLAQTSVCERDREISDPKERTIVKMRREESEGKKKRV
jgi:hypothetical protein